MLHANCSDQIDIKVRLGIHQKKVVPTNAKRGERERDPTSFFLFLSRAGSKWILSEEEKGEKGGKRRRQVFSPLKAINNRWSEKRFFSFLFPFSFSFPLSFSSSLLATPSWVSLRLCYKSQRGRGTMNAPRKRRRVGERPKWIVQ